MTTEKLEHVFRMFSCVGFTLAFIGQRGVPTERYPMGVPIEELHTTGAYHGAGDAWDAFRRDPRRVFCDIERRGDDWHVDVITNAYGPGRYDAWYSARYPSLQTALAALQWLSEGDWRVLRSKTPERNTARRLTDSERDQLALASGSAPL